MAKKKTSLIYYNGQFYRQNTAIFNASNRAFKYGDGIFETIALLSGKLMLWPYHVQRFLSGLNCLGLVLPEALNPNFFPDALPQLLHQTAAQNNCPQNARLRLTVFRYATGFYAPNADTAHVLIEATPLPYNQFPEPQNISGNITIYNQHLKPIPSLLGSLKTTNALLYVLAARYAQQNGYADALLQNQYHPLIESSNSGLIIVRNNHFYTPPPQDGAVHSVMVAALANLLAANDLSLNYQSLSTKHVAEAHEIWLCNAIAGIRPVQLADTYYLHNQQYSKAHFWVQQLNKWLFA